MFLRSSRPLLTYTHLSSGMSRPHLTYIHICSWVGHAHFSQTHISVLGEVTPNSLIHTYLFLGRSRPLLTETHICPRGGHTVTPISHRHTDSISFWVGHAHMSQTHLSVFGKVTPTSYRHTYISLLSSSPPLTDTHICPLVGHAHLSL